MGAVILDAGVVIGVVDATDTHHEASVAHLRAALDRGDSVFIPASALSEALVAPARRSRSHVTNTMAVLRRVPVTSLALDDEIAADAAFLRADNPRLRLSDALVIATARVYAADVLITTDRRWPTKRALKFAGKLVVL